MGEDKEPQNNVKDSQEKFIPQADVDRIVQDRLARERAKYSDYEDLSKKVKEYEQHREQLSQQELEKKQEYDKLKDAWSKKENEYQSVINKTKSEIQEERVNNRLTNEILKVNAYPEAAQLLRSLTKYNDDGSVTIRGKDANGIDADLPIEQGVAQFLRERPYLVKGSGQGGAGTSSGTGQSGQVQQNLSQLLQDAMAVGDRKQVQEIKAKIRAKHASSGISSII